LFVQNSTSPLIKELERALNLTAETYRKNDPERVLETKTAF